jgi:predicted phage baseplate assembly protein
VEGATLPTGVNNLQANYRIGSGAAGNVAAGALTTLIDRPLGVSGVTNPMAATGGQDAQDSFGMRANAPQTVLTLGRAVSLLDYQTMASNFAGIAKAYAVWIPSGPSRGVFLTVTGVNGAALPPGNPTLQNLVLALRNCGNPRTQLTAASFLETLFGLNALIKYDPAYSQAAVYAQVQTALSSQFGFANRGFCQGVAGDAIAATIQAVPGVVAVNVIKVTPGTITSAGGDLASEWASFSLSRYNQWVRAALQNMAPRPASDPTTIIPYTPGIYQGSDPLSDPLPAEILVIDPNPANIVLGVMP